MDRLVRKLATKMAATDSRRDFLSRAGRGLLGASLSALFVFGGQRAAFADWTCRMLSSYGGGSGCGIGNDCLEGDANGCIGYPYCAQCNTYPPGRTNACAGATPVLFGHWACCCNHQIKRCQDCGPYPRSIPTCICSLTEYASC